MPGRIRATSRAASGSGSGWASAVPCAHWRERPVAELRLAELSAAKRSFRRHIDAARESLKYESACLHVRGPAGSNILINHARRAFGKEMIMSASAPMVNTIEMPPPTWEQVGKPSTNRSEPPQSTSTKAKEMAAASANIPSHAPGDNTILASAAICLQKYAAHAVAAAAAAAKGMICRFSGASQIKSAATSNQRKTKLRHAAVTSAVLLLMSIGG